jgi:ectoine hydroxylase
MTLLAGPPELESLRDQFASVGFVCKRELLSPLTTIAKVRRRLDILCRRDGPERIVEADGTPYSVYLDVNDPIVNAIVRHPDLLHRAEDILGSKVYVHQCKVNPKAAFRGSGFDWHQDYPYWRRFDGLPRADALTAAILVDAAEDSTCGPLLIAPGTHRRSLPLREISRPEARSEYRTEESWSQPSWAGKSTVVSPLRYRIPDASLRRVLNGTQLFTFVGSPGDVVFFHGRTLHASSPNLSPARRSMLLITYNSVGNAGVHHMPKRADFISNPDTSPLCAIS